MPTCKKCSISFPNYFIFEGKKRNLKNRKYCLSCSPFGAHNTSQLEKLKKLKITCSTCSKEYLYFRGSGHTRTKCNACKTNQKRLERKKKAVEYKGGKCHVCGYDKCIQALGLNLKEKDFTISSNHCRSWENIRKELDKCVLLCVRCHAEVHAGIVKITIGA